MYSLVYRGWGEVVLMSGDGAYHGSSLWGKLVAVLSQCRFQFFLTESHIKL